MKFIVNSRGLFWVHTTLKESPKQLFHNLITFKNLNSKI